MCFPGNGARKSLDVLQAYGIASVFEGRVFNPNLLIHSQGEAKEYSQVLAVELSIQPHLKDLVSAAKYQYQSSVIAIVATVTSSSKVTTVATE